MNRCEREFEVVQALRGGEWTAEVRGHLQSCASCAETERVTTALLLSAAAMHANELPAAGLVWRRAQVRSQEIALKRATRPLIVMRALSFVFVAVCVAWCVRGLGRFGSVGYLQRIPGWDLMATGSALLGFGFALLFVAVGSWLLLRDGKDRGDAVSLV